MSHVGLKGHQTVPRITRHASRIGEHLVKLAQRLREQGRPQEADYLDVASVACDCAAYSLAAEDPLTMKLSARAN